MKFASNATLFLAAAAATPAFGYTKVTIDIKCKGAKVNNFNVAERTLVAHALEACFNDVHEAIDSDDAELTEVHYGDWTGDEADFLQQGGGYGGACA